MSTNQKLPVPYTMQTLSVRSRARRLTTPVYVIFLGMTGAYETFHTGSTHIDTVFEFYYLRLDYDNGHADKPDEYTKARITLEDDQAKNLSIDMIVKAIRYIEDGIESEFTEDNVDYTGHDFINDIIASHPFFTGFASDMELKFDCLYTQEDMTLVYSGYSFNDFAIDHPDKHRADLINQSASN